MSWRGRDREEGRNTRWGNDDREHRDNRDNREQRWNRRSPTWENRRSPERHRRHNDRFHRDNRDSRENSRDNRQSRDKYDDRRDRDRRRDRERSPRRDDIPNAPSPPQISSAHSRSRSKSMSIDKDDFEEGKIIDYTGTVNNYDDYDNNVKQREVRDTRDESRDEAPSAINVSPGDWFCTCGSYNFKRRQVCYRRNCSGKRSEGSVYGGDENFRSLTETPGITKRLLFRRLDALTTEEKILDEIKERCSKTVLDSIAGITIGREPLTGASKCLAYINFNSIADSTAALTELLALEPPLKIDNRDVLISYYNEPQKLPKQTSNDYNTDYSNYYAQMGYANTQNMSEADRVNAAAAVAQSAISAAQARNCTWGTNSGPNFASTAQTAMKIPIGDGKTVYSAPDVNTFLYDETSGYYYDPSTGLYYDGKTQYFFNSQTNQYMYWEATSCTYIAATQAQQTEQEQIAKTNESGNIVKEPEERKKKKDDQVKVARKVAKDMERWARTLNQKKENAKSNVVMEQPHDIAASKGSADIGFSVLGAGPSLTQTAVAHVREYSPPNIPQQHHQVADDFLRKSEPLPPADTDEGIIDWGKLTCLLCKRKFPSPDVLIKHKTLSDLHKQNLEEYRRKESLLPQANGYRDRAAERRMKFGEDEPIVNKRYTMPEPIAPTMSAPPPSVVDTIGGKMLQKMGWSEGSGLGKTGQGRTAPIEAEQRPALVGLGQKKGIYTPTPGETYRDTVKKLMIARYKEVVGDDD